MKRNAIKWLLALAAVFAAPAAAGAQSVLGDIVGALGGGSGSGALSSAVSALLGNKAVSQQALVGTWSYSGPAIAFKSQNVANQLGGVLAAGSAEKKLSSALEHYGLTKGKVRLTFKADNTYACTVNGRTVTGTYKLSGSTLTLTKAGMKGINVNVKLTGRELQLAIAADKLLSLVSTMGSAVAGSSSLSALTSFMKGFDGVNLGMKFNK